MQMLVTILQHFSFPLKLKKNVGIVVLNKRATVLWRYFIHSLLEVFHSEIQLWKSHGWRKRRHFFHPPSSIQNNETDFHENSASSLLSSFGDQPIHTASCPLPLSKILLEMSVYYVTLLNHPFFKWRCGMLNNPLRLGYTSQNQVLGWKFLVGCQCTPTKQISEISEVRRRERAILNTCHQSGRLHQLNSVNVPNNTLLLQNDTQPWTPPSIGRINPAQRTVEFILIPALQWATSSLELPSRTPLLIGAYCSFLLPFTKDGQLWSVLRGYDFDYGLEARVQFAQKVKV